MSQVECVLKIRSILGESPLWQEQEGKLYWLDLRKPAIYRFDPVNRQVADDTAEVQS